MQADHPSYELFPTHKEFSARKLFTYLIHGLLDTEKHELVVMLKDLEILIEEVGKNFGLAVVHF